MLCLQLLACCDSLVFHSNWGSGNLLPNRRGRRENTIESEWEFGRATSRYPIMFTPSPAVRCRERANSFRQPLARRLMTLILLHVSVIRSSGACSQRETVRQTRHLYRIPDNIQRRRPVDYLPMVTSLTMHITIVSIYTRCTRFLTLAPNIYQKIIMDILTCVTD